MKRQFCDLHAKDSELTDDDFIDSPESELANESPFNSKASVNSLLVDSCCRKCKNCLRSSNQRPNDVALRLKEKSKKKKEAAEFSRKIEQSSSLNDRPEASTMNADDSDDTSTIDNLPTTGPGRQNKSRTSSNNSSVQEEQQMGQCTLQVDCKCETCLKRIRLCEELIAEEENSKKKKAKKKKKKNAKKNADAVEEEQEDDLDSMLKADTEDEDPHGGHKNANFGVVDPTSVDINQWIKVKNKYSGKLEGNHIQKSSSTSKGTTSNATSSASGDCEMESNGFKLIGGKDSADKRRGSNLDAVTKEFDSLTLGDSNALKARLIAIDANMAYIRGEIYDAIHLINECIECDPKCPVYFINRSYYFERSKEYTKALEDAEIAIRLESTEEYLEYSLYRKAMALSGLNQFEMVESVLKSVIKLLSIKCRNNAQVFTSLVVKIEKDLMINRLKKLVSSDYTLPLARLYALKFDSIQTAVDALDQNSRLLEEAGESCLDLQMHLQLIGSQLQKDGSTPGNDSKQHAGTIKTVSSKSSAKSTIRPLHQTANFASRPDLWNFSEFEDASEVNACQADFLSEEDGGSQIDPEALSDVDGDDGSEIYFSDEDEYEMVYSHPEQWNSPKDILQLSTGQDHFFTDELKDPINSKGQKALWIGNVSPNCSIALVSHVFMKFGSVTFCKIFPSEAKNEVACLLIHFDNDISPRLVMTYFKDKVIPGISKDELPLIIRFRNKNDKAEEESSFGALSGAMSPSGTTLPLGSPQSPMTHHHLSVSSHISGSNTSGIAGVNKQPITSECYYWRTTGCDRERCSYKHIPLHKGVDKQAWMRRKN